MHQHAHCAPLRVVSRRRLSSTHFALTCTLCAVLGHVSQKTNFYTICTNKQTAHRSGIHLAEDDSTQFAPTRTLCIAPGHFSRKRQSSTQYEPTRTLCIAPGYISQKTHFNTICTNTHTVHCSGSFLAEDDLLHNMHQHAHCASPRVASRRRRTSTQYAQHAHFVPLRVISR